MIGLDAVLAVGGKLIDKLFPDPQAKAAATLKLMELQQAGDLAAIAGQVEINKVEAAHHSLFIAGWRPFIGWTCGGGFAIQFVVGPLLEWGSGLFGHPTKMPILPTELLTSLVVGMLGLGGLRTMEKMSGTEDKRS